MAEQQLIAGQFLIESVIGQGGMGTVYRGVDKRTRQPVAIKHLKPELVAADPDMIERFAREGAALRQLNHPNIVKVLATLQEGDSHYLVMEHIGGGSLYDVLKAEPRLPVNRVLAIGLELADALTRAHHLKIIHRDIKPANVLIADDGTPRLTDFGVAHIGKAQRITQAGVAVGTPDYFSPEALNGEDIDTRSDIWAFGVLLFEMLAGKRPFDSDNLLGTMTAILTKPVPDLEALRPDTPVALVDLIYRMLEKEPGARIPSVRQVGAELEAIMQGRTTSSQRVVRPMDSRSFATPTPATDAPKHRLPSQTTPFVGRERELTELAKLLEDPNIRLITILGPGGMGKTRLALEVAERQASNFREGVVLVPLAPQNPTDDLVQVVAEAINLHFQGDGRPSRQQLLDHFSNKQMLLVMDNFEHLLDGAPLVSEILQAASNVKIIATSRERLNLHEESVLHIQGMDIPESVRFADISEYDVVKLFVHSARRVQPGFELHVDELKPMLRICHCVQGLPLGLLLAAAWVNTLSLEEVADEISRCLDFLETNMRNIPDRHRSIRAVFESSWSLLTEQEREVFMKLSVFRGGFTREAAQAVTGASLRMLSAFVDKSFVRREPDNGRFHIHELLQHYAQELLDASDLAAPAYEAHATYFADFMAQRWAHMTDHRQNAALLEVKADIENARAAWYYCIKEGKVSEIKRFLRTFWVIYDIQGWHPAGIDLFERGAAALRAIPTEDAQAGLGWILAAQGLYNVVVDRPREGFRLAEEGLKILKPLNRREEMVMALIGMFVTAGHLEQQEVSIQAAHDCLQITTEIGDSWGAAKAKQWLALMAIKRKGYEEAGQLAQEALATFEKRGDHWSESVLYIEVLGLLAITQQRYDEAKKWIQRGIQAAEHHNFTYSLQTGYYQLGYLAALQEDYVEAGKHWHKASRIGEGITRYGLFGFTGTDTSDSEYWGGGSHSN